MISNPNTMENILKQEISKNQLREDFYLRVFRKIIFKDFLTDADRLIFKQWCAECKPNLLFFEHYRNKNILFEIVKYLENSELCLNEDIRWLLASKIDSLLYHFYFYRVLEYHGENSAGDPIHGLSMYKGLANFKERPKPPHNPQEKALWQQEWRENYKDYIKGYDFGLDLDGTTFQDSYNDAHKVFQLLTRFKVRFSIWCSGKKGFHCIVPYEEFEGMIGTFDVDKVIMACKGLMADLTARLKLKKVDTKIYSSSRYLKAPYSVDARNNRVIYPLNDIEFLDFANNPYKYMSIEYCHGQPHLGFRGAYPNRPSNKEGFINLVNFLDGGEK